MLLMMIVGGFDLSVGSVGAASSVVAAFMFVRGWILVGIMAALATGLVVGLLNGFADY
jgi:ribose transport system permease protein